MSVNLECCFQDYTQPLKRVDVEEMVPDTTYITLDGSRIKMTDDRDVILVKSSPLVEREVMTSLSPKALNLFYILINKQ